MGLPEQRSPLTVARGGGIFINRRYEKAQQSSDSNKDADKDSKSKCSNQEFQNDLIRRAGKVSLLGWSRPSANGGIFYSSVTNSA